MQREKSIGCGAFPGVSRVAAKAFTLIELLIVVAIIAILAAIAVPNFLEAQMRAKISKVKTDQRTLATGIEAYAVDYSRAPLGFNEGTWKGLWVQDEKPIAWARLTTPVAYLTSIPLDPFSLFGQRTGDTGAGFRTWKVYIYQYMVNDPARSAAMTAARNLGFSWFMNSLGPMRTNWQPWVEDMLRGAAPPNNVYDATNGTISRGYISRTNKGAFTGS